VDDNLPPLHGCLSLGHLSKRCHISESFEWSFSACISVSCFDYSLSLSLCACVYVSVIM
jgi:hypothetical protein